MIIKVDELKPSPYKLFVDYMTELLVRIDVLHDGQFSDTKWTFESDVTKKGIVVDFNLFNSIDVERGAKFEIVHDGIIIQLTTCELAKVLWLDLLRNTAGVGYYQTNAVKFLALLFAFLNSQGLEKIDEKNIVEFYCFALSHKVDERGVSRRLSPPAYQGLAGASASLSELSRTLKSYRIVDVLSPISTARALKALDEACRLQLGMTLSDYKNGGSFNFLGLDIGRHYLDHCGNLFEEHFQFAVSARGALNEIVEKVNQSLNHGFGSPGSVQPIAAYALTGTRLEDIPESFTKIWKAEKLQYIYNRTLTLFRESYNEYANIASAFRLDTVNLIAQKTGLPERYDVQEFVRSILFTHYIDSSIKSSEDIFLDYFAALRNAEEAPDIGHDNFLEMCIEIVSMKRCYLPDVNEDIRKLCEQHSKRLCLHTEQESVRRLKSALNLVESSGATLFVGLLGWRRSEYGFPLSNIKVKRNEDILDNLYIPFRFEVNWVVPKTSGKTKIDREITLYSYLIAYLLDRLNLSKSEFPALYYAVKSRRNEDVAFDSTLHLGRRVDAAWPDFILYYSEFVDIDRLGLLSENSENARVDSDYYRNNGLAQMRKTLLDDLPKYHLCRNIKFGNKLMEYSNGTLDVTSAAILDNTLPEELKNELKSGNSSLAPGDVSRISTLVLQDTAYPTPHALRHVWAEAVLRRYRGDVGKFIRANFKHLDESFFMAYLRDKESKAVYEVAKRQVINTIVRQQIMALKNNDREYAGGFDLFLSRAIKSTKVVSPMQYADLANKISKDRIVDIKSNAWGTCLLRVGTEKTARCSVDGVPQRHNAEPKLCLGCVNANISEGNFNGIVVYIKADIEACRNVELPTFIKELHIPVVKLALKRVRQLGENANHNNYDTFITHLEETLEIAQSSIS